jgi:hypothetical protein
MRSNKEARQDGENAEKRKPSLFSIFNVTPSMQRYQVESELAESNVLNTYLNFKR